MFIIYVLYTPASYMAYTWNGSCEEEGISTTFCVTFSEGIHSLAFIEGIAVICIAPCHGSALRCSRELAVAETENGVTLLV